jgi:hypothetical protein
VLQYFYHRLDIYVYGGIIPFFGDSSALLAVEEVHGCQRGGMGGQPSGIHKPVCQHKLSLDC